MGAPDYEALAQSLGATVDTDPHEELARQYGAKISGGDLTPMQGANAVATGINRAVLMQVPGLPVATAINVADLARAGYGYLGGKLGFLSADELPQLLDRARYVGSPEWIAARIESIPGGASMIDNPRPDLASARILNAGGNALGSAMTGNPRAASMQFASGVAGQIANELGAPPALSITASMAPQAAAMSAAAGTRAAFRGGDAGRQEMLDRMSQFQQAGIDPTVGLATGNRRTQSVESLLSKTPGGAGPMAAKVADIQEQAANTANAARDNLSPTFGPVAAGDALKTGITGYRRAQQDIYGRMNERAAGLIPPGMTFPVPGMIARGADTLANIPGAPSVTRTLNAPLGFTQDVVGALQKDAAPQPSTILPSRILGPDGQPLPIVVPGTPGGIPFEGIQGLKARIGQLAYANNPLLADANTGALKSLYGGAKSDLMNAGTLADAERVAQGQPPGVAAQLSRANKFYSQTQDILENTLAPIYKAGDQASEKSFYRVESDARNSGTQVTQAMASLPLDVRRQVAATVVDRLGRAAPGQQNAEGSAFSPQTFLTNWNRITPEAKNGLLLGIPNGVAVGAKLDSLAQAATMMRDANKVYANPSGTSPASALIGTGAGLATGAGLMVAGHTASGLTTLGSVLGSMAAANLSARTMTNPKFVTWLSKATEIPPSQLQAHANRLSFTAMQSKDPQERQDLGDFAGALSQEVSR